MIWHLSFPHCRYLFFAPIAIGLVFPGAIEAQAPATPAGQVQVNMSGPTPLESLVEYVSKRTGKRFLYDNSLDQKQIVLQSPSEIPVESLFDVLQSALQINQLAIAATDNPGWYRIVPNTQIASVAVPSKTMEDLQQKEAALAVTTVFALRRGDPNQIRQLINPFLAGTGSNVIAVPANRTLIVTDTASNLRRIVKLIDLLDAEQFTSSIRFVRAEHVAAQELADKLNSVLEAKARTETGAPSIGEGQAPAGSIPSSSNMVEIAVDERLNQLILVGLPTRIEAALEILKVLDVALATASTTYSPQFLSAQQLQSILESWIESMSPKPNFDSQFEGNGLTVRTTEAIHEQIRRLLPQLDSRETSAKQSPIRFYKIKNVPVQDILDTLNSLQGGFGANPFANASSETNRNRSTSGIGQTGLGRGSTRVESGSINSSLTGISNLNSLNGLQNPNGNSANLAANAGLSNLNNPLLAGGNALGGNAFAGGSPLVGVNGGLFPGGGYGVAAGQVPSYSVGQPFYPSIPYERGIQSPLGNALVTADIGSNTLIIIAEPPVQQAYEQLIEFLDKRRPQVMIEARIVIIDTSDNYTLGVEVSGGDRVGARKLFAFSSYGLSTVNPASGALTINPGQGFNATLVDPTTADVVVRALTNHRRAKVLSSPKILVDDNATGTLTSVNEVPFTSVNASQTVATTSFAGFAEAGTTITVTPTISEERHVNLDYIVTLNSFTGTGSAGVPPPRQTNEISSRVTVPDTYTIIVGGLAQKNVADTLRGIPYLENIPLIRELSSLQTSDNNETSLFVFLRPVIVDDDKFRDLIYLSTVDSKRANEGHNFPASEPLLMTSRP
jgi:general secretion pathway protein D